jgi:phospholipid/cholesterol/gamma-HCH transport system substrate-binding protein
MNRNREFLVGLVILAAIVVAVGGTLWLQGTSLGRTTRTVEAILESAGQLSEGNPVTYRGVRIGTVETIDVEPGGQGVRIRLQLSDPVELPADAALVLGPESLFGAWQAEVVSKERFPRFNFYEVPSELAGDGSVLGGFTLPEITRLTASAEQISQNLADLTDRLDLAFNQETADNLASTITNIEAITQDLRALVAQQSVVAAGMTANADTALLAIEGAAVAARRSFERLDGVLAGEQVDSIVTNIRVASAGMRTIAEELSDPEAGLAVTLSRADSTFARADRITARLESGEGSLGRLLVDSTFAVNAEDALRSLDLLLQDLRENPGRYVRISIF